LLSARGSDLLGILTWGAPGIALMLGALLTLVGLLRTRRVSRLGARLRFLGLGLAALGWIGDADVSFVRAGAWPSAVLLILLVGWAPLASFWLAARVTGSDPG